MFSANWPGGAKLSEGDVDAAMREVRLALLEADVNYKVVKDFVARVRERAVGAEVMRTLTPGQQVVKIVNEELIKTLGEPSKLDLSGSPPHVIMLVGLQGSGKTTTAAKLALRLRKSGHRPLLVAADPRPSSSGDSVGGAGQAVRRPRLSREHQGASTDGLRPRRPSSRRVCL